MAKGENFRAFDAISNAFNTRHEFRRTNYTTYRKNNWEKTFHEDPAQRMRQAVLGEEDEIIREEVYPGVVAH